MAMSDSNGVPTTDVFPSAHRNVATGLGAPGGVLHAPGGLPGQPQASKNPLFTLIGLVTKLVSDLCYVWVDPRVRFD